MTRNAEAALLATASLVAAAGVALSSFTEGEWLNADVLLTLLAFAIGFGLVHLALRRWAQEASPFLLPLAAFLAAIGFTEIYRLDPDLAALQRWSLVAAGIFGSGTVYLLRNDGVRLLRRYRYLFLLAAVLLLLLPLLPASWPIHGATVNGARLWVRVDLLGRTLSFQPGELAKVFLTIFLASYLADRAGAMAATGGRIGRFQIPAPRRFGPILVAAAAAFGVLVYQRDLGASLLIFLLFVGLIYIATGRIAYLIAGGGLLLAGGLVAYQAFSHVQERIGSWLHPFDDYAGSGYQVAQSLFALGSGSLTGSGVGLGRPELIPAASTDFIFAAVGEELGLAGTVVVIAGYALLVAVGFGIAIRARDVFAKYLAAGLTLVLAIQAILIIGGVIRLLPVTGITLPFMSYGGSSLVANMVMLALLAMVSREQPA